jgi:hypothetical protein
MSKQKPEPKDLGMIGSNKVVDYGGVPCIVINKTWLSMSKVKTVLANIDACRQFILRYDVQEPAKAAADEEKAKLIARIKELESRAAGIVASGNGHNRLDPLQKAA